MSTSFKSRFVSFVQKKMHDQHPDSLVKMSVMYDGRQHFVKHKDWEDFINSDSEFLNAFYSVDLTGKGNWKQVKSKLDIKKIPVIWYWSKEKGPYASIDLR